MASIDPCVLVAAKSRVEVDRFGESGLLFPSFRSWEVQEVKRAVYVTAVLPPPKTETEPKMRVIQGLYAASDEGSYWLLLARVVLARFAKEDKKLSNEKRRH